jgi:ribosomal-protein-alanine N-acetyltransferase
VNTVISTPDPDDLEALAELAAGTQSRADRYVAYVGTDAMAIATDIGEVGEWQSVTTVARVDGVLAGWLLAETDRDMGRAWLWGPFVADDHGWAAIADAIYTQSVEGLPEAITELEMAGDDRHVELARLAELQGFAAGVASTVLSIGSSLEAAGIGVRPLEESDRADIASLHDRLFPGTHTPGAQLGLISDRSVSFVVEFDRRLAGYVVAEEQADGSGYIEFVGVDPAVQRRGLGGALLIEATNFLFANGADRVHLTVREDNVAARNLYAKLGFFEERIVRPYRRGFTLP